MDITFIDKTEKVSADHVEEVENLLQFAADFLEISEDTELSVTFMDNEEIRVINRDYRGKDTATDVISFALEEEGAGEMPIIFDEEESALFPRNLGDLMISIERAEEQAADYGHSFERELGFLAVHGFLHLNGYDHMNEADEKEMFDLQKEILNAYGLER
ncbi:rRNA maturation RNase YbeY [Enterococcus sp. BWB1-3]|uniref:rRNA maturation RNase YbeY n=1 Tax=unclassified Enterococcus TaxID=2608891 RepID=UPI001923000E|nr:MULTISPECIES: rRNA maturation RNase YbeY [unclassified Enterococcus]MBL1228499.1 rRNA maturation RNase YbeY [Enterococcus sp. BWB1-3]MCB5950504.1 rRNA maturation RNase YbeY [Enterococcus sp. BWT-B8]